ncbi:hypothetical protein IC582_011896 [Cucumis melo]
MGRRRAILLSRSIERTITLCIHYPCDFFLSCFGVQFRAYHLNLGSIRYKFNIQNDTIGLLTFSILLLHWRSLRGGANCELTQNQRSSN